MMMMMRPGAGEAGAYEEWNTEQSKKPEIEDLKRPREECN